MQQYLPFTVLKLPAAITTSLAFTFVATVPTVYGIETVNYDYSRNIEKIVATVPTVYGIETTHETPAVIGSQPLVATVPTVYGIETKQFAAMVTMAVVGCNSTYRLRY